MESVSTVMTSSGLSTPTTTSLDMHDDVASCTELRPQIRILRHYCRGTVQRASSASPPTDKRRAGVTLPNGTRRQSPAPGGGGGGTTSARTVVVADCSTATVGVRSLPATPLPPSRTGGTTARTDVATTGAVFTNSAPTTTTKTAATDTSSLLVVTQTSNNARTSYSTFDGSHVDVPLPVDGIRPSRRSSGEDAKSRELSVDVEAPAPAATGSRRWRVRREAVVGTPQLTPHNAQQRVSRLHRCLGCLKSFVAFLFSTIGLTILLVGYTILGGIIFQALESSSSPPPHPPSLSSFIELSNKVVQRLTVAEYINSSASTPSAANHNSTNETFASRSASSHQSPPSITVRLRAFSGSLSK